MQRQSLVLGILLAILLTPTMALGQRDSALTMVRLGTVVIAVGDPESKVFRAGGQPVRAVALYNARGAPAGERLVFANGGRHIHVVINGGTVTRVWSD